MDICYIKQRDVDKTAPWQGGGDYDGRLNLYEIFIMKLPTASGWGIKKS